MNFPNPPIGNQCLNLIMKPNLVAGNNVLKGPRSSYFAIKKSETSEEAVRDISPVACGNFQPSACESSNRAPAR